MDAPVQNGFREKCSTEHVVCRVVQTTAALISLPRPPALYHHSLLLKMKRDYFPRLRTLWCSCVLRTADDARQRRCPGRDNVQQRHHRLWQQRGSGRSTQPPSGACRLELRVHVISKRCSDVVPVCSGQKRTDPSAARRAEVDIQARTAIVKNKYLRDMFHNINAVQPEANTVQPQPMRFNTCR